ncbi:MAG: UDP-2,4-diacetamido-2,4,6-trideoxy-beta-L-altropyranose hydrolase [Gemmobacter sp.]|uniref:UDP-2,4-diacetamido-2,4, 6-trideoxy-beta-L-altropyranose hydrolase n=1 Tax=Gemmobacter sp. TaxID=1898957 RepID=UPI0039198070
MKIVLRADASADIGTGHIMRCLTLARALAAHGHDCRFLCRDLPGNLNARIAEEFPVTVLPAPAPGAPLADGPAHAAWAGVPWAVDAAETRNHAGDAQVLVVDHYAFDARWQIAARPFGCRLVAIDDLADRAHACDLLVDPNYGRFPRDYDALMPEGAERLMGTTYALLRPEFAAARAAALARPQGPLRHVLIAMGGVDRDNATARVLQALAASARPPGLEATVVMGAAAPHLAAVSALAATLPFPCRVLSGLSDMTGPMLAADLAIGAAGGTAWERCTLALPTLMLVLADNQIDGTAALDRAGAGIALGRAEDPGMPARLAAALARLADPAERAGMAATAAAICDGRGTERVVEAIEHPLRLRPASMADAEAVWRWRETLPPEHFRAGPNPPLPDHLAWFARALADPTRHMLIAESERRVAHLRLDVQGSRATVSILLRPGMRGRGYGQRALAFLGPFARRHGITRLVAEVATANEASLRLFRRAGYTPARGGDGFLRFERLL